MERKEAYEFIKNHVLQAIYNNAASDTSMKAGYKRMKEAFKVFGVNKYVRKSQRCVRVR